MQLFLFFQPVQSGTLIFIKNLKTRFFPDGDEIILRTTGHDLSERYLEKKGFKVPILVENKEGLGLLVPPPTFTVSDVEQYVGERNIKPLTWPDCQKIVKSYIGFHNRVFCSLNWWHKYLGPRLKLLTGCGFVRKVLGYRSDTLNFKD